MDKDTKNLIFVIGVAIVTLIIFRPKKSTFFDKKDLSKPSTSKTSKTDYENGIIAMKAMRAAINAKESNDELNNLNTQISEDYGLKVFYENDILTVRDKNKNIIVSEK